MKKKTSEVAKRYAIALLELAQEQNALQQVVDETKAIEPYLPLISDVLVSPIFSDENKNELLNVLMGQLKVGSTVGNCLRLILKNRRFALMPQILKNFYAMVDDVSGVSRGTLLSARTLDPDTITEFEAALSARIGKKVFLTPSVEESLRAGYVVEVSGTVIDASLKTRLKSLRDSLSRGV